MPRDLPISNGSLLINFDRDYVLRDLYYPHVGQENQTDGHPNRFGVWVDGDFSWLDGGEWRLDMRYAPETLVTSVTCENDRLGLKLTCADCVDVGRNLYVKRVEVHDRAGRDRRVRLFQHLDLYLWGNNAGDTAFYDPDRKALVAYKGQRYLWLGARAGGATGITHWATGRKGVPGAEGTWRDAEDGDLGGNPIAQGSVDCVGGVDLMLPANASGFAYVWIAAGQKYADVRELHDLVLTRGPESFLGRTEHYWRLWVNRYGSERVDGLSPAIVDLYKRSLLVIRTQVDDSGAIIAATDSDILQFGRDTYAYMWPRDGALVANAMIRAGHGRVPRRFFEFCASVIHNEGYLLHKFNPDGSTGSSWHPWLGPDGSRFLPIQEDETALTLWALSAHFDRFRDVEFISELYRPLVLTAADFLCTYREPRTGLPAPSYDLWEERHGINTFTTAAVVAGLEGAARLVTAFGDREIGVRYRAQAEAIRNAAREYLFDPEKGHFSRMINVRPDGRIERDSTLDASINGIHQFGLLPPDDPMLVATMEALERRLWCQTPIGGLARYENDYYHQVSQDIGRIPGNPWFICTLWLANWHATRAQDEAGLARAHELIEWATQHALASGVLAEQVHPETGAPISVSPLTWSHAAFVNAVEHYLQRQQELTATAWEARKQAATAVIPPPVPEQTPVTAEGAADGAAGPASPAKRTARKAKA
jgi:GH15 family glucan-1,4-alpha-glucosidase